MIRVLRLGSSIDLQGETPPEARAGAIAARMLAEASGEEVDTVFRGPRPTAQLPEFIDRWLEETSPDLVCFNISSFWCEGEVAADRMAGMGRPGAWLSARLRKATRSYSFNANPMVRGARKVSSRALPGRPPYAPEQAAGAMDAALRRLARSENLGIVVCGSPFSAAVDGGAAARRRARQRRSQLIRLLGESCEALRIPYDLPEHAADAFDKSLRTRDGLHFGPEMHRRCGELQGRMLVAAWQTAAALSSH